MGHFLSRKESPKQLGNPPPGSIPGISHGNFHGPNMGGLFGGGPCTSSSSLWARNKSWRFLAKPGMHGYLVGGWATPLKNMSSSIGMMTFPIYGKMPKMATTPPTRYEWISVVSLPRTSVVSQVKIGFTQQKKNRCSQPKRACSPLIQLNQPLKDQGQKCMFGWMEYLRLIHQFHWVTVRYSEVLFGGNCGSETPAFPI